MTDDPVDDGMLCDDGDDLHFSAAFGAEEWVHLDLLHESSKLTLKCNVHIG